MAKNTVQDWSATAASNTDVGGINIQGSAPVSNMDDALRAIMAQVASGIAAGYFNAYLTATKTANYTVLTTDRGTLFDCTSSLTLSLPAAATATAGFVLIAKANGASVILDPNGAELIDGAATVTLTTGQTALIVCTGTAWKTAFIAAVGPASSTDNAIVRFDGTTGKTLQNSGVIIDDSDNITMGQQLTMGGASPLLLVGSTSVTTGTPAMEIGNGRTGSGAALIDLHGQAGTDYDTRIIRNAGANGSLQIVNNGSGGIALTGNTTINGTLTVTG